MLRKLFLSFFFVFLSGCGNGQATPTTTPSLNFLLQVYVGDKVNNENISSAEVKLQLSGQPLIRKVTNSDGIAVYQLEASVLGQIADLTVEAQGYQRFTTTIQLNYNDGFPIKILLEHD